MSSKIRTERTKTRVQTLPSQHLCGEGQDFDYYKGNHSNISCLPPSPSKEERGKTFQGGGEDPETDPPTSHRPDFRMWKTVLSLGNWWALCGDAVCSPLGALFQGLPLLAPSLPGAIFLPLAWALPSLQITSCSPKRTVGSFFPPHMSQGECTGPEVAVRQREEGSHVAEVIRT